jgi:hypothetical protein
MFILSCGGANRLNVSVQDRADKETANFSCTEKVALWRRVAFSYARFGALRLRHVRQIFIDRPEIFVGHSSDGLPRHLLAKFMAIGIDAGAHGGDEFLKFPSLYRIEVGPERRQLTGHTAGQPVAMAGPAILIRQNILAILQTGTPGRCRDDARRYRLPLRKHPCAEHRDPQQVEMVRRIFGLLSGSRQTANVCDDSFGIVIAQFAGISVGHDNQPVPIAVDAVANGPKNIAIRPVTQSGGREVGGHKRSNRRWKILGDVEPARERAGS